MDLSTPQRKHYVIPVDSLTITLRQQVPSNRYAAHREPPVFSVLIASLPGLCGINGENCTAVDISLANAIPSDPGSGSSAAVDIVPPHAFTSVTGFGYYNGCDGAGQYCTNPNCIEEIPGPPPKTIVPVFCQTDNVCVLL